MRRISSFCLCLLFRAPCIATEARVDQAPPGFGIADHQIVAVPGGIRLMAWIQYPPLGGDMARIQVYSRRDLGGGTLADPVLVSTTLSVAGFSNLRLSARGNHIYAVWERVVQFDPTSYELRFNHSGDGGATWEQDRALTPAGMDASGGFSLDYGPDMDVYVAFSGINNGQTHVWLARSEDNGNVWQSPLRIDHSPAGAARPELAADLIGRMSVVWRDGRGGASIFANRSRNRGSSFQTTDSRVSIFEGLGIEVRTDGAGHFYTCFEASPPPLSFFQAYVSTSLDAGGTWSTPLRIDDSGAGIEPATLELAAAGTGHLHTTVVYKGVGLFYRGSDDDGATFRPPVRLDAAPEGTEVFFAKIANNRNGLVLVPWAQLLTGTSPGVVLVTGSSDFGRTWSGIARLSGLRIAPRAFPEIALDLNSSGAAVAWEEGKSPRQKLFFNSLRLAQ